MKQHLITREHHALCRLLIREDWSRIKRDLVDKTAGTSHDTHDLDHAEPWPFYRIVEVWTVRNPKLARELATSFDAKRSWRAFHADHAVPRLLTIAAHAERTRRQQEAFSILADAREAFRAAARSKAALSRLYAAIAAGASPAEIEALLSR